MVELRNTIALPERYDLTRHIANGGMASVWAAEDKVLGRCVAIKVMAPQLAQEAQSVLRFEREARAAARLSSHPNVVTIFDVGEQAGRAYIVMEYLPGGSVADALRKRRPADRGEAVRWLRDGAAALDTAHDRGVVHRDVKPGNFLLDDRRRVRVGDFGIARVATEDTVTSTGDLLGTAAYLSPEQSCGKPAQPASDVYSLTVVAFELLTGTRPFTADNFAAQARQHLEEEPPPATSRNPELPAAVDDVLGKGLAKDPEDRWASAGALVAALERALDPGGSAIDVTRPLRAGGAAAGLAGAGAGAAAVAAPSAAPEPTQASPPPPPEPPRAAPPRAVPEPPRRAAPPPAPVRSGPRPTPAGAARRSRGPWIAAGVLAAALVAGAIIALAGGGGPDSQQVGRTSTAPAKHSAKPRPTPSGAGTATTPAPTTPRSTAAPAATGAAGGSATTLQDQGHALIAAGRYDEAIPVLRKAVAAAPRSSDTYAFALFDLGHALRLAGRPQEAVPILQQRLQIPNQPGIVRSELALAEQAAGGGGDAGGGGTPPPTGNPGKGVGKKEKAKGAE